MGTYLNLHLNLPGYLFDISTILPKEVLFFMDVKGLVGETFKMEEPKDVEITFLPTSTSKIHLHVEQLLQNTY